MTAIEKMGEYLETDAAGYIVNTASEKLIQEKWRPAVDEIVRAYKEQYGDALHSVYLRGSVAKGKAADGVSDIDTYAFVDLPKEKIDRSWIPQFAEELMRQYPFVNGVELIVSLLEGFEHRRGQRIAIKTQGICLYGKDLDGRIPQLKPGKDTVMHVHSIAKDVQKVRESVSSDNVSAEDVRKECTWIMKRILRTGCELVMERSGKYTRDLYPCYELFVQYYPEQAEEMRRVLDLAINPTKDEQKILTVLDGIGVWVGAEARRVFGDDFVDGRKGNKRA